MTDNALFGSTEKETEEPKEQEGITKTQDSPDSLQFNMDNKIPTEEEKETAEAESAWMINSELAGEGNRPEWFREKYKTVEEQAMAYADLEKMKNVQQAPEKYDFTELPKDHVLDMESDAMKEWIALKKEGNTSDVQFKKELSFINKYMVSVRDGMVANKAAEIEKLGGAEVYEQKRQAFENTICNILDKETANIYLKSITSADAFNAHNKLIAHFQETPVADINVKQKDNSHMKMSKNEYMEMIAKDYGKEYAEDKSFKKTVWENIEEMNARDGTP